MRLNPPSRDELDPIEIASKDEISALQLDWLKWSLTHAYQNVPFFRKRFNAVGVHPDELKFLENLAKIPFFKEQDLRDNYPFSTTTRAMVVGYNADIDICGPGSVALSPDTEKRPLPPRRI